MAFDRAHANDRSIRGRFETWFSSRSVCVLTIGKTASSAVIDALLASGVKAFQVHSLVRSPQNYLFFDEKRLFPVRNSIYRIKIGTWMFLQSHSKRSFITSFRDPFERNISAFFEQIWKIEGVSLDDDLGRLIKAYTLLGPHDAPRLWFKENLAAKFGWTYADINLASQGSREVTIGPRRFLILKYERRDCWADSISNFVGVPVTLQRRNDSGNKVYGDKLSALKENWRPSRDIVKRTIDIDLWDALYTKQEKASIRDKWGISKAWLP